MPNTYIYVGESPLDYPYPPLRRHLTSGDEVELTEFEVPRDGRFRLKGPDGELLPLPPLPKSGREPDTPAAVAENTAAPAADASALPARTSPVTEPPPAPAVAAPAAKAKASKTKE